jgi:hypothetical protein
MNNHFHFLSVWNNWRALLLACVLAAPLGAQIPQDHPELCGRPDGNIPLPTNVWSSYADYRATFHIRLPSSTVAIEGHGAVEIQQVCPLPGNRLLVFGPTDDRSVYAIELIDAATGKELDSLWGRSPAMSPDRRWLAFREFYPAQSDIDQSESYWLYDLTKDRTGNKIPGTFYGDTGLVGYAIYPIRREIPPGSRTPPSPEAVQTFTGGAFHWAPDSTSLMFTDSTEKGAAVVLARIGPTGVTTYAYRPGSSACSSLIDEAYFDVGHGSPGVEVQVTFSNGCPTIFLHPQDFKPAEAEFYRPVQKRPSIQDKRK